MSDGDLRVWVVAPIVSYGGPICYNRPFVYVA